MAADNTYQPKTYRRAGGDEHVIASGGKQIVESGGIIELESGALLNPTDYTAAGGGLSPLIWSDCPRLQMLLDPTLGFFVGDNFLTVQATGFPYELSGANGTFAAVAGQMQGVARLDAPGTDNDESFIAYNNDAAGLIKADASHDWWFEARVKLSQIAAEQGVFVGLAEETGIGVDFMTDNTMVMKVVDAIGFQIVHATAAAAVWQSIIQLTGGARAAVNATLANGSTNFVKLGMKSVSGVVTFYVDGVANATTVASSATNFPLNQVMSPVFATKTGKGAQNYLDLDWWYAAQLR
jgi:hypothetical protein